MINEKANSCNNNCSRNNAVQHSVFDAIDRFADNQNTLSAEQILSQLDAEERSQFETLADRLKITDLDEFFDEVRSRSYSPDDYIDLDGDGDLTLDDALFVAQFLNGMVDYAYDYNDMDATNDHVIDEADAMAYMSCYSYHILFHNPFTPGTHGAARTIDPTFEYRWYVRYDYQADPPVQPYQYLLHNSNPSYVPQSTSEVITPDGNSMESITPDRTNPYENLPYSADTRIVHIGETDQYNTFHHIGTGFIVKENIIASAAHCIYNNQTHMFNPNRAVRAITYELGNDNTYHEVLHPLTIKYAIVPLDYYNGDNDYDYGMIVVQEDLSNILINNTATDLGMFSLGILTEGVETSQTDPNIGLNVTTVGIHGATPLPRVLTGKLYQTTDTEIIIESSIDVTSASGSAAYYSDNPYESVIGIITARTGTIYGRTTYGLAGSLMTRPLLEFYLNQTFT